MPKPPPRPRCPPTGALVLTGDVKLDVQADASGGDGAARKRTFSMVAYTGGLLRISMWDDPVIVDLQGVDFGTGILPILDNHTADSYSGDSSGSKIVGQSDAVEIKGGQITARGEVYPATPAAKEILKLADAGFKWQASIGGRTLVKEHVEAGASVEVNGQTFQGPVYVSRKTELREISFVVLGADADTSVLVASGTGSPHMEFSEWLQTRGFDDPTKLSEVQRTSLEKIYAAEKKVACDDEDDDDEDGKGSNDKGSNDKGGKKKPKKTDAAASDNLIRQHRERMAAESERTMAICAICAPNPGLMTSVERGGKMVAVALQAHAIKHGLSASETRQLFELETLRAERQTADPTRYSPTRPDLSAAVIECAVLQAGDSKLWDKEFWEGKTGDRYVSPRIRRDAERELSARYPEPVQQAAHTLFHDRIGLQQVLAAGASLNGYRGPETFRDDQQLETCLRAASWDIRAAEGASTISLGNLLANVLNKYLLEGYLFVESAWQEIAATRPVKDFKPTKSVNLWSLDGMVYKPVGADGELKHATLADQAFPSQVYTYGRRMMLPRQTIINDDLSALTTVPRLMGRGAALAINDAFWTTWLTPGNGDDGNPFWGATHGNAAGVGTPAGGGMSVSAGAAGASNYIAGAGSTMSSLGLQNAVAAFDKQVGPDGAPLGVDAEILLVPPELWVPARELVDPTGLGLLGGSSNTALKQPNVNVWRGMFKLVKSRYLSNARYPGYSALAWWLLANPGNIAAIEAAFLNGQMTPTVQTAQADFQQLGIQIRGFSDFGINAQNYRAGVKSAGA